MNFDLGSFGSEVYLYSWIPCFFDNYFLKISNLLSADDRILPEELGHLRVRHDPGLLRLHGPRPAARVPQESAQRRRRQRKGEKQKIDLPLIVAEI